MKALVRRAGMFLAVLALSILYLSFGIYAHHGRRVATQPACPVHGAECHYNSVCQQVCAVHDDNCPYDGNCVPYSSDHHASRHGCHGC